MRTPALCALLVAGFAARALAQEDIEHPNAIEAVQEREYRMNNELLLGVGVLPLDVFTKSYYGHAAYAMHFTDSVGLQLRGLYTLNVATPLRQQLERDFGFPSSTFATVNWAVGGDLLLTPFYGKASVANRSVMHFETFIVLGGTAFNVSNGGAAFQPALNFGIGGRLFQSKLVSYRLDLTNNVVVFPKVYNIMMLQLAAALNFGATE